MLSLYGRDGEREFKRRRSEDRERGVRSDAREAPLEVNSIIRGVVRSIKAFGAYQKRKEKKKNTVPRFEITLLGSRHGKFPSMGRYGVIGGEWGIDNGGGNGKMGRWW